MKTLLIGATGATGKELLRVLLDNPAYTAVTIFVRRSTNIVHSKLTEVITDFENLEAVADRIQGDLWFSVLGTTLKTAGSKEKQWKIDHDIPLHFASIAKRNGLKRGVLLSAYGASTSSRIFYNRMKGELERAIEELQFEQYIVFRPGLLLRPDTDRFGEKISAGLLKFLNRLGILRKFRPLPTSVLAQKLARAPLVFGEGKHVVELNTIFSFEEKR